MRVLHIGCTFSISKIVVMRRRSSKNRSRRWKITTRYKYSTPLLYKLLGKGKEAQKEEEEEEELEEKKEKKRKKRCRWKRRRKIVKK